MSDLLPALSPALTFDAALLQRAQPVRVVFFDVDGVLTDGGLLVTEQGETRKRFNPLDGHGIKLLYTFTTPTVASAGWSSAARCDRSAISGGTGRGRNGSGFWLAISGSRYLQDSIAVADRSHTKAGCTLAGRDPWAGASGRALFPPERCKQ
jgi:hypothetical protein